MWKRKRHRWNKKLREELINSYVSSYGAIYMTRIAETMK
jgi:hypothetical protein